MLVSTASLEKLSSLVLLKYSCCTPFLITCLVTLGLSISRSCTLSCGKYSEDVLPTFLD